MAGVNKEVGRGYISLLPSLREFKSELKKQLDPKFLDDVGRKMGQDFSKNLTDSAIKESKDTGQKLGKEFEKAEKPAGEAGKAAGKKFSDEADREGKKTGSRVAGWLGTGLKRTVVGAAAAVGVAGGVALSKGFSRLESIDNAKTKMEGLKFSATQIDGAMKDALASVKGTAFGLGDAANIGAQMMASGIKPGKDLEKTLKTVADAATIAGSDMGDLGGVFSKIAATGKLQGDTLMQLSDRGLPVLQYLSDHYKVSTAEAQKMVSAGKVDFETFQGILEKNVGGAAASSGKTFSGAMSNMMAAAGRLGASVLEGVFPQMKEGLGGLTKLLDDMGPIAEEWGKKLGVVVKDIADWVQSDLIPALKTFAEFVEDPVIETVKDIVKWLEENRDRILLLGQVLLGAAVPFLAYKGYVETVTVATKLWGSATGNLSKALGFLKGHPILVALSLLTGAFILLYNTNEDFRNLVDTSWARIKDVVVGTWNNHLKPALINFSDWFTKTAMPAVKNFWEQTLKPTIERIGQIIQWVWGTVIKPVFGFVSGAVKVVIGVFRSLWTTAKFVFDAISLVISTWWNYWVKPIVLLAVAFFKLVLVPAFQGLWAVGNAVFTWIGNKIVAFWNFVRPYFQALVNFIQVHIVPKFQSLWDKGREVFTKLGSKISSVWNKFISPTFEKIKSGIETVRSVIGEKVDKIGALWNGLKLKLAEPIYKVIGFINDPLIKGANQLAEKVGLGGPPGSRTQWIPDIDNPWPPKGFYTGGKIPGNMPGYGRDNLWGVIDNKEPIRVASGEWVVSNPAVDYYGDDFMAAINARALPKDMFRGFARGGGLQAWPNYVRSLIYKLFPAVKTIGGYRHGDPQDHGKGLALDVMVPVSSALGNAVAAWAVANRGPLNLKYAIWKQAIIGSNRWQQGWRRMGDRGSVTQNHYDHPHLSFYPGMGNPNSLGARLTPEEVAALSASGGGGFGIPNPVQTLFDKIAAGVRGTMAKVLPGGPPQWLDLGKGVATKSVDAVLKFLDDKIPDMIFGSAHDAIDMSSVEAPATGSVRSMVQQMASQRGWTGPQWNALDWIINKESSWRPNAQNPTSTAYGLFQFLNSTWGTVGARKTSDPSGQAQAGLQYIAQRYGNPINAQAFWRRNGWYNEGGKVGVPTFDVGGTIPPGLSTIYNATGKPETLVRPELYNPTVQVFIGDEPIEDAVVRVIDGVDEHNSRMARMG